jgi:uncharacterized protein YecE (DUF72 family)
MNLLQEKLGPLLLQFPRFSKYEMQADEFSRRLRFFLNSCKGFADLPIRGRLDKRFTDLLREYNVALALTDTSFMPRPWEMKGKFDLVTTDFVYVRWLGDRHGIEKITQVWDRTVVDSCFPQARLHVDGVQCRVLPACVVGACRSGAPP